MNSLASLSKTRDVLNRFGLTARKSFGQHFLINDHILQKIIALAELAPHDSVVEIGPGIGTLSQAILETGAKLVAVEKDGSLLSVLKETVPALKVLNTDALNIAESELAGVNKLVANLPYSVAATIILKYFQSFPQIKSATVMVQKEVADRIKAKPGTKDYGAYTLKLQLYATPNSSFSVSPSSFFPPPKVDSTVIRLERNELESSFGGEVLSRTVMMIESGFTQRRKTIRNSMLAYLKPRGFTESDVDGLLSAAKINPKTRAETLCLDDFVRLAKASQA
jgi:16S rRNA (adenine1518-N6/adenine1519-N6)-dimethyltransferase